MSDQVEQWKGMPNVRTEISGRWVRVRLGGETIADSKQPVLVLWYGPGYLPTYFFPKDQVRMDLLTPAGEAEGKRYWTITAGDRTAEKVAWSFIDPPANLAQIKDHITFVWEGVDGWYEEEEEIFVHARDPYKRIDVMPSARHVRIEIDGVTVADTQRPHMLFETHLPIRYYLPAEDVEMTYLASSSSTSRCPYKGIANYWSVEINGQVHQDVVWGYDDPIPECPKIKGLVCFYNEKVDVYVDGQIEAKPQTPWS